MGLLKELTSDYAAWLHSLNEVDANKVRMALFDAVKNGKFGAEPGHPNVFYLGTEVHDFDAELADPDCFGQPKDVEFDVAFQYLFYRRLCKRHDVQPGPFVDQRYYVKMGDDGDVEVVQAEDC